MKLYPFDLARHASCAGLTSQKCHLRPVRSSKETLIDVKARRAALKQKLKCSDEIEEQQKILNKLKLQQELSETLAEEAIRS